MYNGVHYPSDVLTGALMGWLWGTLFIFIVQKLKAWMDSRKARA
jgi:membrane-associated phospholipid phosphatase